MYYPTPVTPAGLLTHKPCLQHSTALWGEMKFIQEFCKGGCWWTFPVLLGWGGQTCADDGINCCGFQCPGSSPCLQSSWKVMWCSLGLLEMLHFSTFLSSTFTHLNTGRTDWKKNQKNQCSVCSPSSFAINTISLGLHPGFSQAALGTLGEPRLILTHHHFSWKLS